MASIFAYLHMRFGCSKEKWFEQLKVDGEWSVVGQVMAAEEMFAFL